MSLDGQSRRFVATSMRQRFDLYCRENNLDPRTTRHVRNERDLLGNRGGTLVVLPDFVDDWEAVVAYARTHDMEVKVL